MRILKDLFKDYRFTIGFIVLCLLVFLAIASFFSPYDPIEWLQVPRDEPPSWPHILGTILKAKMSFGKPPLP